MALFGTKKPTLTVTAEPLEVLPGHPVQVRVDVEGEVDDKVRAINAGLRANNRYRYEDRDSRDNNRRTGYFTETIHEESEQVAAAQPQAGSYAVTLTVPAVGPPSARGTVRWEAWARVDRPGRDVNEEVELAVLAPWPLRQQDAQEPPVTKADCTIYFDGLSAQYVKPGDQLQGTLLVSPREGVKTTGVRVELRAVKTSHSPRGTEVETVADVKAELAGAGDLAAGQTFTWPFSLMVPPDAVPSLQTSLTTIQWKLVGVVARRMRGDHSGHMGMVVYNG